MTTVGYGDEVPVTPWGKFIASIAMMSGMLILALPISVIGSNFQQVMKEVLHDTIKKNMELVTGKVVLRYNAFGRDEVSDILRSFQIVGEDIDIDPDELIALYDVNHTGTLEDDELMHFKNDLEELQNTMLKHRLNIVPAMTEQTRRFSQAAALKNLRNEHEKSNQQLDVLEEVMEMRLLESEVRMEAQLNKIMAMLTNLEKQVDSLQS
ncbi:Voltage-gated Ion Channel (VIC) Superfamily [Thraustotheca clavata]|uniref:Voltage-gated Ion Channel (VIC) Superfamily n=1 Tax=Thraustotheca clavata TaxID=74557 RepID=A0A1V9YL45_9STRA|nr:Voltage-gated Ion Channel (VIC) Superfamily [Thraustotheca clavata]